MCLFPIITFNIKPLKKIEESKFEVYWSKEKVKEINFYFNDSSLGNSKDFQDSHYESLSWEPNFDFHHEIENEQPYQIFSGIMDKSLLLQKNKRNYCIPQQCRSFRGKNY